LANVVAPRSIGFNPSSVIPGRYKASNWGAQLRT
jgi:hypothetical protein